jgi:hypothetical protein
LTMRMVASKDSPIKRWLDLPALCRTNFFKQPCHGHGSLVVIEIRFPLFVKYHCIFAKVEYIPRQFLRVALVANAQLFHVIRRARPSKVVHHSNRENKFF